MIGFIIEGDAFRDSSAPLVIGAGPVPPSVPTVAAAIVAGCCYASVFFASAGSSSLWPAAYRIY